MAASSRPLSQACAVPGWWPFGTTFAVRLIGCWAQRTRRRRRGNRSTACLDPAPVPLPAGRVSVPPGAQVLSAGSGSRPGARFGVGRQRADDGVHRPAQLLDPPWRSPPPACRLLGRAVAAAERLRWGFSGGKWTGIAITDCAPKIVVLVELPSPDNCSDVAAACWTMSPGKSWLSAIEPQSLSTQALPRSQTWVKFLLNDSQVSGCRLPCQ